MLQKFLEVGQVGHNGSVRHVIVYRRLAVPNAEPKRIRLKGLDPNKTYRIEGLDITAKGATLLNFPLPIKYQVMDFYSAVYRIVEV